MNSSCGYVRVGSEGDFFFFNLNVFHSSCSDLISASSTERGCGSTSRVGKLWKAEGNQI